ncbi:MAG: hypothetical protein K6G63_00925, partial [Eubacterium sp.]|nr:hypothetical protein [Eubacterium sp.]
MILTKIKAFFNRWKQAKRYNWKKYDYSILIIVTLLSIISSYVLSLIGASSFKRQFIAISLTVVIMV